MSRVGIVVALAAEGRTLSSRRLPDDACLTLGDGSLLTLSHAGPEAAKRAAVRLRDAGANALVSWGCAAALAPQLVPGDLVLPSRVLGVDGRILNVAADWRDAVQVRLARHLSVHDGVILESAEIVSAASAKAECFAATGAVALDMESAAVARIASELPFLAVRSIVDAADHSVPSTIAAAFDAAGKLRVPELLTGLVRHPGDLGHLIRLGWHFRRAMQTLRKVAALLGPNLANPIQPSR